MIEKKLKTTDGYLTVKMPSSVHEITLGKVIELGTGDRTNIESVSILSDTPMDELYNVRNIDDFRIFQPLVKSLYNDLRTATEGEIPKEVYFEGYGSFKVLKNLSVEPVGAYLSVSELIEQEQTIAMELNPDHWKDFFSPSLRACLDILAHYFYSYVTKLPYTERGALDFAEVVAQLPCTQAMPISKYFFLNYPHLTRQKIGFFQAAQQVLKLKPGSENSKSSDE